MVRNYLSAFFLIFVSFCKAFGQQLEPLHSTITLTHDTTVSLNETYHWIDFNLEHGVMIEQNLQTRKSGVFDQHLTGESWDSGRVILRYIPWTSRLGWSDTISAFDIRYNYYYIEATLRPMASWGQPRTLYRYWDGVPLLTLTSNLYIVEGIGSYRDKSYVGYWDNNYPGNQGDSNIIGKITMVRGLGLNKPPLQKQIVRIKTKFDLDDRGSEEEAWKVWNSVIALGILSKGDNSGRLHDSRNASFGEIWLDADKQDFTVVLKCRGEINETFRIPVHNGKLDIRLLKSKYFEFSFE